MINYIITEFQTNQMLTGIVGGGLFLSFGYLIRSIPNTIFSLYKKKFVWNLKINNDNKLFNSAVLYFGKKLHGKIKHLKIFQNAEDEINKAPSYGNHFYFSKGNLVVITILSEESQMSLERKESLDISIYGLNNGNLAKEILFDLENYAESHIEKKYMYYWNWDWTKTKIVPDRTFESIFIDENTKKTIIDDITKFYNNTEFYIQKGFVHKRGYLFYGRPGTGKSSLITAIANHFDKRICYLDLSEIENNKELRNTICSIPKNSILVLEDIDIYNNVNKRNDLPDNNSNQEKISFSSVLQMMDGSILPNGTIIIATTNYFEKLDSAFVRDGRFDIKIEIFPADKKLAKQMINYLAPDKIDILNKIDFPIEQANLQNMILQN